MKLDIQNEMDVMLAHRRAMQFAKFSGIGLAEQTRFATAVSEICRNAFEYARQAFIEFNIRYDNNDHVLQAVVTDKGSGIADLTQILNRNPDLHRGRGVGIVYAKRLSDSFGVVSNARGTTINIQKRIPEKSIRVSKLVIDGWLAHVRNEPVISAYEELKIRNMQLVELTEQLRANSLTVEKQILEIQQLNNKLSANNERMKEFTYAISHDLKNPLSSLKIATDHLCNNPQDEQTPLYHGILSRSVNRLDRTIHGLIEILDIQHQQKDISKPLHMEKLFQDAQEEYSELINETKAVINVDFSGAPAITYVEGYLLSVFHNLISNSIKYRHPENNPVINISTKTAGGFVTLKFSDNGLGMDLAKIKHKIFLPFSRFSNSVDGKGIGLYLIKSMVENNGGSVSVESEVGKGTTFIFNLRPYK